MMLRLNARAGATEFGAVSQARLGDRSSEANALLWYTLADGTTRTELVDRILAEYPIDRDQAESHADEFVSELRRRGLLVES